MVEEISEMEEIEQEQQAVSKGLAYTYSSRVVKKRAEDYLQHIEAASCGVDQIVMWRVDRGGDLYNCLLAKIFRERTFPAVIPTMVGTVTKASLGYFLSDRGIFHINTIVSPTGLELVSGGGTVSIEEGRLMPHIHIVVANPTGNAYGGHLFPGTTVKEYVEGFLIKLRGIRLERVWNERVRASPLRFLKEEQKKG